MSRISQTASWRCPGPFDRLRSLRAGWTKRRVKLTSVARREPFDSAQDRLGPSSAESIIFVEGTPATWDLYRELPVSPDLEVKPIAPEPCLP